MTNKIKPFVKKIENKDFLLSRKKIEKIDSKIFKLLEERYDIVKEIGKMKKKIDKKTIDRERENYIINKAIDEHNLSPEFIKSIYRLIFKQSYKNQK